MASSKKNSILSRDDTLRFVLCSGNLRTIYMLTWCKYMCAIKELINSDPHITVKELVHIIGISTGSVDHILKLKLNLSKVCARWVPYCLTKAQMATRVRCSRNLLKLYKGADTRRLFEVVTGDETWVQYSTPLSKESNKVWKESHSDP